MNSRSAMENPFRPGAGHPPPFFAGRVQEQQTFARLLQQQNPVHCVFITGGNGYGKTSLLEQFRQRAEMADWIFVSNELSESSSLSEERLVTRIIADLSSALEKRIVPTQTIVAKTASDKPQFPENDSNLQTLVYGALRNSYESETGSPHDKLQKILLKLGTLAQKSGIRGIVLAYDKAQHLNAAESINGSLLSMLMSVVGSTQTVAGSSPCMLVLSGLSVKPDKLNNGWQDDGNATRFTISLDRLTIEEAFQAISNPIRQRNPPMNMSSDVIYHAARLSGGHPYLIQLLGKELIDQVMQHKGILKVDEFPSGDALERLESGFFGMMWKQSSLQEQELLRKIVDHQPDNARSASKDDKSTGFSVNSCIGDGPAGALLDGLCDRGILYKTPDRRYAFTVPMSEMMIKRRLKAQDDIDSWSDHGRESNVPGVVKS